MKKILHITECLGSGVLNYIKNITAWQITEYEVYLAYAIRPETPENFKNQFDGRVCFIYIDGFTREIDFCNDLKAFKNVKRIVKSLRPDLIHLHSTKAGVIGRWAVDCNKYRVLYSPHAYSFLMMDCSKTKRKLYQMIEKLSDRKKCLTIADSSGEYEISKLVTQNAVCIPNGINPFEMDYMIEEAERLTENHCGITICTLGKVTHQKNPRLFNEIAKQFPECKFIWIGAGPLENVLTSSNISITGWLTRPQAIARIMDSDMFLFPTLWESLSIALMEVMYLGKPCVVSKCDGNKDVIKDGINGFLCDSIDDYAEAIRKLLHNSQLGEKLGAQAKKDIVDIYNVEQIEKKYRNLFGKIGV